MTDLINQIETHLQKLKDDHNKFMTSNNLSAGTRVRGEAMHIKKVLHDLRVSVLNKQKEIKQENKEKKTKKLLSNESDQSSDNVDSKESSESEESTNLQEVESKTEPEPKKSVKKTRTKKKT